MGKVILPKASYETARVAIMGIDPFYHPHFSHLAPRYRNEFFKPAIERLNGVSTDFEM